jgi:hypothetical protein
MAKLIAHVITEQGSDVEGTAQDLEDRLTRVPGAELVRTNVEKPRVGLEEILAVVQITEGAVNLIKMLVAYVEQHRGKAVKEIEVEVDGHRVAVDKLTPAEHDALVAALTAAPVTDS